MITNMKKASAVQGRRVDAGKSGIAKAVRRFLGKRGESACSWAHIVSNAAMRAAVAAAPAVIVGAMFWRLLALMGLGHSS